MRQRIATVPGQTPDRKVAWTAVEGESDGVGHTEYAGLDILEPPGGEGCEPA